MTYLDALLLGIIQGLTEFLPVSSSGHLVLGETLLGVRPPGVSFEVALHVGTLLAVLVYFRRRLWAMVQSLFRTDMVLERRLIWYLIVGSVPAALVGLSLKKFIEATFAAPALVAVLLLVTGLILLSTHWSRLQPERPLSTLRALFVGCGQALAILPGISRSGTTISTGLWLGLPPVVAAEFSFLLSIPAVAGAAVLDFADMGGVPPELVGQFLAGALTSLLVGWLAIHWLLALLKRGHFTYFAYYCFAVGLLGLYLLV